MPGNYDETKLLEMLADGAPYDRIAQAVGISTSMVAKIAQGRARPDFKERLREIKEARRRAVRDLAIKHAADVMRAHIRDGVKGSDETARKCREYILAKVEKDSIQDMAEEMTDAILANRMPNPFPPPALP